ncbi:MAG TPA: tetraacyldisaccharide 4'-kinase [Gemmatimonadaceae bacterium]|nr:tetraacyldisaccharide 4'-kinase [Gemmatimonadaceae bacterium]
MTDARTALARLWTGTGKRARLARTILSPLTQAYGAVVKGRGLLYDRGLLKAHDVSVPVVSVGNLTVGGTGKTPVAAWLAGQLVERGANPAIVLRGYGGDETLVHQRLNETISVIECPDRVRGMRDAIAEAADVIVLDDAFQHRRAARDADIVLIDADTWTEARRLLPAGPWREPLTAARRASLIIITRKTASEDAVNAVKQALSLAAPRVPSASLLLAPGALRSTTTGQTMPLHALDGADVTAIAAIANPVGFFSQLTQLGAIVRPHGFPDHYAFTMHDARRLAASAQASDFAICTLKDAVKLESFWPAEAGSLWYVSQRLKVEDGKQHIDRLINDLLALRQ